MYIPMLSHDYNHALDTENFTQVKAFGVGIQIFIIQFSPLHGRIV